mmetsp:Transcript_34398/g.102788  ORF Transcript_34398/g.102788 Transcript_34398/m.102788 type:complete len:355 (-) Transcript_34398:60-1124(-)
MHGRAPSARDAVQHLPRFRPVWVILVLAVDALVGGLRHHSSPGLPWAHVGDPRPLLRQLLLQRRGRLCRPPVLNPVGEVNALRPPGLLQVLEGTLPLLTVGVPLDDEGPVHGSLVGRYPRDPCVLEITIPHALNEVANKELEAVPTALVARPRRKDLLVLDSRVALPTAPGLGLEVPAIKDAPLREVLISTGEVVLPFAIHGEVVLCLVSTVLYRCRLHLRFLDLLLLPFGCPHRGTAELSLGPEPATGPPTAESVRRCGGGRKWPQQRLCHRGRMALRNRLLPERPTHVRTQRGHDSKPPCHDRRCGPQQPGPWVQRRSQGCTRVAGEQRTAPVPGVPPPTPCRHGCRRGPFL